MAIAIPGPNLPASHAEWIVVRRRPCHPLRPGYFRTATVEVGGRVRTLRLPDKKLHLTPREACIAGPLLAGPDDRPGALFARPWAEAARRGHVDEAARAALRYWLPSSVRGQQTATSGYAWKLLDTVV